MKTTRAQFLSTVATGLAATALNPSALFGANSAEPAGRSFQSLVGETLRFSGVDGRSTDLVLTEFEERPSRPGLRQFTLTLAAPGGEALTEGTYTVDHPRTGTFPMFIVPTGRDAAGETLYRADFNLLLQATAAPAPVKPLR